MCGKSHRILDMRETVVSNTWSNFQAQLLQKLFKNGFKDIQPHWDEPPQSAEDIIALDSAAGSLESQMKKPIMKFYHRAAPIHQDLWTMALTHNPMKDIVLKIVQNDEIPNLDSVIGIFKNAKTTNFYTVQVRFSS